MGQQNIATGVTPDNSAVVTPDNSTFVFGLDNSKVDTGPDHAKTPWVTCARPSCWFSVATLLVESCCDARPSCRRFQECAVTHRVGGAEPDESAKWRKFPER